MHHVLEVDAEGPGPGSGDVPGRPSKKMSAAEAVERFVPAGAVVGMGGQNINRCPMALVHEVIRQSIGSLTIVGCNLSIPVDFLVTEGLVEATEQGSANLERFGVLFCWRRAVESGVVSVSDYSHLSMASRFLAGAMGLPFMPERSLLGSSVLEGLSGPGGTARTVDDPFDGGPVVLIKACMPDVSLIHASRADTDGNVVIDGVTSHEIDMVRASASTIVSAERVLPAGAFDSEPERVTISGAYVSAVVEQPYGAWPTSVYRLYDFDEPSIAVHQSSARKGDDGPREWIDRHVHGVRDFEEFLELVDPGAVRRTAMEEQMRSLM